MVGVIAAIGQYGSLIAAVELGHLGPTGGALVGFVVGTAVSYVANRRLTFKSSRSHAAAVPRFLAVAASYLVFTAVMMTWLAGHLGVHYLIAQLITTVLMMVWTFVANRFWTFSDTLQTGVATKVVRD